MAQDLKDRLPADEAEEAAERRREMAEGLELLGELRAAVRRGGLVLGGAVALLGWYLSRDGGVGYLIGGVVLGLMICGGAALSGALAGTVAKKYMKADEKKQDGASPR
ncbi:MAG: hypothetical protein IKO07_01030 [Clostridia bacterium]|nr:hypothetical protein [Clostridia bacterium]